MKRQDRSWTAVIFSCALMCLLLGAQLAAQTARKADIAVVVHPDTPVSSLSLAEVRKVFLGDRQYWTANVPVVLIVRAPVAREREAILKIIYQMTESRFKQYWVAKIFRAEATSGPKIVYSNDTSNQLVAAVPGAIAFMEQSALRPGLKVLRVDGYLPGDPKYPLR